MDDKEIRHMRRVEDDHWWFRAKDEFILHKLIPFKQLSGNVLDMGCGTGRFLHVLETCFSNHFSDYQLFGLDMSDASINYASDHSKALIVKGNAAVTGFADNFFSLVVTSDVLEHLEDDGAGLKEIFRILSPGGYVVVTVPAYQWLWSGHDKALSHKRRYTGTSLSLAMKKSGFALKKLGYYYGILFPLLLVLRSFIIIKEKITAFKEKNGTYIDQVLPPSVINKLLYRVCVFEREFCAVPFGSTVYAVAQKEK
ncbi:MAG TPA: hypothetical protein DF296_15185 [Candidatus Margulisbacteria bacterium]|nr:MAG: hypothetical protein A2X42_06115 [Candidatus Margulisbacteria bacterium GWF2_38_17]OGI09823.1 MAG: hypothetical protein A2X41_09835 [Candidatus Margulisbacteria bacterium GWE2_39_32]HCT86535.1 hypothetical protein [Candidatus Margulisiibacteriota bacterium]